MSSQVLYFSDNEVMFFLGVRSFHKTQFFDDEVSPSERFDLADRLVICLNGHRNFEQETRRGINTNSCTVHKWR